MNLPASVIVYARLFALVSLCCNIVFPCSVTLRHSVPPYLFFLLITFDKGPLKAKL